ncbi:MAG: HAD family phosphatase [Muribaculaceae bacterium]|nr:HAD family phosphatase [Muribaculaceae bacterium]
MKTLYVTDLDGTLLEPDSTLAPESARLLAELTAGGALITCATARTPATVQPLLAPARLHVPAIVMTGAALWDWQDKLIIDSTVIPAPLRHTLDAAFASIHVTPFIYTLQNGNSDPTTPILSVWHANATLTDAEQAFVQPRAHLALKRFYIGSKAPNEADAILYFAMGRRQLIEPLAETIRATTCCSVHAYPDNYLPDTYIIEVLGPEVSKARAVLALKRRLGADRLVVFGDNLNDLPMMAVADLAVAAPTALPPVRTAAHLTLPPAPTSPIPPFIAQDLHIL